MSTFHLFSTGKLLEVPLPPELRPYQKIAIETLRKRVKEGKKRILLVAPTGAGKMVLIANIIKTSRVHVLFIAHRMELLDQCADQLEKQGLTNVGILRGGDKRANASASVQVASIMTLVRRNLPHAGLILIDEAHRSTSDSYKKIIKQYPEAIVIGFTATPCRMDQKPLGDIYESLEIVATYKELIKDGYILEPTCYSAPIQPDLGSIHTIHGDFDEGELSEVMSDKKLVGNLVEHWLKLGRDRSTFVFAVKVKHSLRIKERFEAEGIKIAHLDGSTPEVQRREILKKLSEGDLQVVTNCNVLLEGVDIPRVKCVVHARPTKSLVLYMQSVGRILRPWGDKKPILLDHAGNFSRHGSPHEDRSWSLDVPPERKAGQTPMKICPACYAYVMLGLRSCPYCHFEFEGMASEIPGETHEELQQIDTTDHGLRRFFFEQALAKARKFGFKPGYASAQFKERYGDWPVWAWSQEAKVRFASDPSWQALNKQRDNYRQSKQEADIKDVFSRLAKKQHEKDDDEPEPPKREGNFSDWLDDEGIT